MATPAPIPVPSPAPDSGGRAAAAGAAAIALSALVLTASLAACSNQATQSVIPATGTVVDETVRTLSTPPLLTSATSVDLDAGFMATSQAEPADAPADDDSPWTAPGLVTAPAPRLIWVGTVGVRVRKGQVIARYDARPLLLAAHQADASAAVARSKIAVIDDAIATTSDKSADLRSTRASLDETIAQITRTRADLVAKRAQARKILAALPPLPPAPRTPRTPSPRPSPGPAPRPSPSPPKGMPTPAQLRAVIAKLTAAIAKIDTGLTTAYDGRRRIDDGLTTLADARAELRRTRPLAIAAAEGATAAAAVPRLAATTATLTSPIDGTIVDAAATGSPALAGAPVITVRPDTANDVTAWLSPSDVTRVCVGTTATVRADGLADDVSARVDRIGASADYPPTSYAGGDVHLTRAIPVRLHSTRALPPGLPVSVDLSACPTAPSASTAQESS